MQTARPFEHLVIDDLFHPALLELVREEFDGIPDRSWRFVWSPHERTRRAGARSWGAATALYFGIVNSAWFLDLLSEISGVADLLADPWLANGGLHETREDGAFDVHLDFDRHARFGFRNELSFITYLNTGWEPSWGGALELWDATSGRKAVAIEPSFGRSVLFRHGPRSFHGHPSTWTSPVARRSVASYYYTYGDAKRLRHERRPTRYFFPRTSDGLLELARGLTPPLLWRAAKRLAGG
jgi:hypothetical protein